MKKASIITIEIPVPCPVDLNEMASTSLGKFCTHCQKEVIDARTYDAKSIHELANKNPGHACMILAPEMLERNHVVSTSKNWWPAFIQRLSDTLFHNFYKKAGVFLGLNLVLLYPAKAQIKGNAMVTKNEDGIIKNNNRIYILHGQVLDTKKIALNNAEVIVRISDQIVAINNTDSCGNYLIHLRIENYNADNIQLEFRKDGYIGTIFPAFVLYKSIVEIEKIELAKITVESLYQPAVVMNKKAISLNRLCGTTGGVNSKSVEVKTPFVPIFKINQFDSLKKQEQIHTFPRKNRFNFEKLD